ncbi:MAG: 4-hydroxy-tetrahydrodipicolinate reductase [Gammaproteobacteria bacterium]
MNTQESTAPVRIALLGAAGRMGTAILASAAEYPGVCISAVVVRSGQRPMHAPAEAVCSIKLEPALDASDVLLDFSAPAATAAAVAACVAAGKPLVTGVTGLDARVRARLAAAGKRIAVLAAPNMSIGANLLIALTRVAAAALDAEFDLEIVDIHHRDKRDAPSGTAWALGEAAARARNLRLEEHALFTRHGQSSARAPGSIGFASLRAGDVAGEHRVLFAGPAEILELSHRAENRAAFARGALAAARWIVQQNHGEYGMADVLNLHTSSTAVDAHPRLL